MWLTITGAIHATWTLLPQLTIGLRFATALITFTLALSGAIRRVRNRRMAPRTRNRLASQPQPIPSHATRRPVTQPPQLRLSAPLAPSVRTPPSVFAELRLDHANNQSSPDP